VEGGTLHKVATGARADGSFATLPEPPSVALDGTYNVLITGVGGTGVITIGALMGMAAHLEGKGVSVLDMTGVSQKNGAVTSHVRIASQPSGIQAQTIATGEADLILGCDMLTAGAAEAIAKTRPGRTVAVINTHEQPTGHFAQNPDWQLPAGEVRSLIAEAVANRTHFVDATGLATALLGDSIATNLFMLGFAYQLGLVPLSEAAIHRAIELNRVAVDVNKQAFLWGRRAACDVSKVERAAFPDRVVAPMPQTVDALIKRRMALLTEYQSAKYAREYEHVVRRVQAAEQSIGGGDGLTRAVAQNLYKLMAYKDEYEVARLYANGEFARLLGETFDGKFSVRFHLAPPIFSPRDRKGRPRKISFGPWLRHVFTVLAKLKFLRGTIADPFGYMDERRTERRLIADYRNDVLAVCERLAPERLDDAIALARIPETIRGFGHVKQASIQSARARWETLKAALQTPTAPRPLRALKTGAK
jgi:indolepyruvate ferredoxin oxidoreductase